MVDPREISPPHPEVKRKVPNRTLYGLSREVESLNRFFRKILRKPTPPGQEFKEYGRIDTSYREYNRTFGINSEDEMKRYYKLHPNSRGAIVEIAGYGVAPNDLAERLQKKT